jgi:hypothetical protein
VNGTFDILGMSDDHGTNQGDEKKDGYQNESDD